MPFLPLQLCFQAVLEEQDLWLICRSGYSNCVFEERNQLGLTFVDWLNEVLGLALVEKMSLFLWESAGKNCQACHEQRMPHMALDELLVIIIMLLLHWKMNIARWDFAQMCDLLLFIEISIYTCMPLIDNDLLVDCFMVLQIHFCSQHMLILTTGKNPVM